MRPGTRPDITVEPPSCENNWWFLGSRGGSKNGWFILVYYITGQYFWWFRAPRFFRNRQLFKLFAHHCRNLTLGTATRGQPFKLFVSVDNLYFGEAPQQIRNVQRWWKTSSRNVAKSHAKDWCNTSIQHVPNHILNQRVRFEHWVSKILIQKLNLEFFRVSSVKGPNRKIFPSVFGNWPSRSHVEFRDSIFSNIFFKTVLSWNTLNVGRVKSI